MDSAYKERVNCLKNLDSQDKGHRQQSLLEKERKKTEESVKHFKHMLGWKRERDTMFQRQKKTYLILKRKLQKN